MKIVKFKKSKNNLYEIVFDNDLSVSLYDDVIVKYNLLVNKTFDDKKLKEILDYSDSLGAYYSAIKYIEKRLRCEKEIREYLKKKEYNSGIINKTILRLQKDGYLSHDIYIKSYINDTFNFKSDGPEKIKRDLITLGFSIDEIDPYLELDFKSKVNKIIDKKFKSSHNVTENKFKEKMSIYLYNLGYPKDLYIDYLNEIRIDNSEILIKDYIKLYNKYEKMYEKDKLMMIIKDKLYKKGYNISEINEVISDGLF